MNYTYLPPSTSPYNTNSPLIIMTTNPASKKMANLLSNPHVSLLVHDWVSHRPPTTASSRRLSTDNPSTSPPAQPRSSLASLLLNLNTSAMSSISATINGSARLIAPDSAEERWFRQAHLENNTFDESSSGADGSGAARFNPFGQIAASEDGGRECFVAGEEVRVIVVDVRDVRISDWKGNVKDWVLVGPDDAAPPPVVNGA